MQGLLESPDACHISTFLPDNKPRKGTEMATRHELVTRTNKTALVALCIASYKRPVLLKQGLLAINQLNTPENLDAIIIVVDNDSEQSAKETCDSVAATIDKKIHYYVEPDRGISSARNRLLQKAMERQADFIAFIDDDEMPHRDWLKNIYHGLLSYSADIATGPVFNTYKNVPSDELPSIKKKYETGTIPRYVSTNNVIFKARLIGELGLTFDRYFDFIGNEDHDFFERAYKQGCKAVWVNDAVIFEALPPERDTFKYRFYRHYTGGISRVLRYKKTRSAFTAWLYFIPKALGKVTGALFSLICAIINRRYLNKAIFKIAHSMGLIAGLLNIVHERYRY